MITLLASITGFISSIIPEILKILKDQNDKKHALNLLDRQIEINKLGHTKLLTELDASKDVTEIILYIQHINQALIGSTR
jgi:hypothetical protein